MYIISISIFVILVLFLFTFLKKNSVLIETYRNKKNKITIYIERHGESLDNLCMNPFNHIFDPVLTNEGIRQCKNTRYIFKKYLKKHHNKKKPDFVFSSVLLRAMQTAYYTCPDNKHIYIAPFISETNYNTFDKCQWFIHKASCVLSREKQKYFLRNPNKQEACGQIGGKPPKNITKPILKKIKWKHISSYPEIKTIYNKKIQQLNNSPYYTNPSWENFIKWLKYFKTKNKYFADKLKKLNNPVILIVTHGNFIQKELFSDAYHCHNNHPNNAEIYRKQLNIDEFFTSKQSLNLIPENNINSRSAKKCSIIQKFFSKFM